MSWWLVNDNKGEMFPLYVGVNPPELKYREITDSWSTIKTSRSAEFVVRLCSQDLRKLFKGLAMPEPGEAVHVLIDIKNVGPNQKDASVSLEDAGYDVVTYERENETVEDD